MIKSFNHVGITVKNLDKTIEWYVNNLGFSVGKRIENKERGTRIVFLEINGRQIVEFFGFFDHKKAVDGPTLRAEETGIKHVSFSVDDMAEMCQKLKNIGVEFTTLLPERAVFKDLNGMFIEIRPHREY